MGNNVFIGSNTTILSNVKIGNEIFIAAGSVVTKDLIESGVYGGIPAHKIGDFNKLYERRKQLISRGINDVGQCWDAFDQSKKHL